MHINFSRLIIHNFMSFGHVDLKFEDSGFIRVSGINDNPLDNAGSNGSGKSSLWEAIVWAITGETIRGTKHIVNFVGTDGCYVDIEFYIDKLRYQIIRSKDHAIRKTNIQLIVDGQDISGKGIRDSERILREHLPDITSSLLGSVIILGQGLPQKFTNNTPSGRKEVLEQLSKSDFMIEDLKKRVADRRSELSAAIRSFEDSLLKCTSSKEFLESQIQENTQLLNSLDKQEIEGELESCRVLLSDVEKNISASEQMLGEHTQKQTDIKTKISCLNSEESSELYTVQIEYNNTLQPLTTTYNKLSSEITLVSKEIQKINSIKDICPTCGQRIPDVHKPDTSDLEKSLYQLKLDLDSCSAEKHTVLQAQQNAVQSIKDKFQQQKHTYESELSTINNCIYELKRTTTDLHQRKSELTTKYNSLATQLAQLQTTIDNCYKTIRDNNEKIKKLDSEIMYNNAQKDLTQSHIDVVSKFDTALKRDFRGYLLSTVITFIENRAKYYSNMIFDNDNVTFCLDGNNIDISYMDKPYENLSGGEKQKIDLIIQFSIRDMLSKQLGFTSNILVLDEVFDGLDSLGCEKVIDMIASLSDIKNIFIVTHRKDLSIPSDKELVVVKSSAGISEIINNDF